MTVIETATTPLGDDPTRWSVFASDIPLPPGQWPVDILVKDRDDATFHFQRSSPIHHHGDFAGYTYTDGDGHRLEIFNT